MKHSNQVLGQFWRGWRHQYLLELSTKHQHHEKSGDKGATVSASPIVLTHDENHFCGVWKLAAIEKSSRDVMDGSKEHESECIQMEAVLLSLINQFIVYTHWSLSLKM